MKIAIFHSFLDNIGGAEMVTLTLAKELNADIYTTNIDRDKIAKMGFENLPIYSIGPVPLNAPFRHQMVLWRFRYLNLKNKYDFFIIAGDWAVSSAIYNRPNLWYIHSPMRELWDLYPYTRENNVPRYWRLLFDIWVKYNRKLVKYYIQSVDKFVCNSANTQKRIKKYLKKDAQIIHPPIDTKSFYYNKNGDFWLSVNRLINHKRINLQIESFRSLPDEKLIIVGSYEKSRHFVKYADEIQGGLPSNIKIKNWVSKSDLIDLYANCKGFITTSLDEDFGMTPVEAMAAGKPVIAPNEGGYKETIISGKTGILIEDLNTKKLSQAIKNISQEPQLFKTPCQNQAQKFDTASYIKKIKQAIEETLATLK